MKKVTFVAYNIYGIGGTVRFIVDTANFLSENGYDVQIISLYTTGEEPKFSINKSIKLIPLISRSNNYFIYKVLHKFPSLFDHKDSDLYKEWTLLTDVILFFTLFFIKTNVLICSLPYFTEISQKLHLHKRVLVAQEHRGFGNHTSEYKKYLLSIFKKADYLHCVNNTDREKYQKALGGKKEVICIHNSTAVNKDTADMNARSFFSCGRLAHQKNYTALVRAFSIVTQKFPDWKLEIYGNGYEKEAILREIARHGLEDKLTLHCAVPDIVGQMRKSSIYVCSSVYESFCLSLIEAMQCGMAVITYLCDGPKDYVEHMVNGILVEQENERLLAEAMCLCAEDADLRRTLGQEAKRFVDRVFSMRHIGRQWLVFLERAMSKHC